MKTTRLPRALPALGAMLVAVSACTTNPVTGERQLDLIGEQQEIALGKELFPAYVQDALGPIDDAGVQAMVERVGESVAGVSHRPDAPYAFTAVNDPAVNAFALPGGKICITRGLVSRLRSEDGLAAVLGHEVGHVAARHVVASYNRQVLATALILGGAAALEAEEVKNRELITLGAAVGAQLALAHYSRDQERQADELGLEYAVKAGYSPQGMIETQEVLLSLQKTSPGLVQRLFASHPMSSERLAIARSEVAKLPAAVRDRPVETASYQRSARQVIAARPAWDLADEGRTQLAQDRPKEAVAALDRAVEKAPGEGVLRSLHALALAGAERGGDARAEAREGARLAPDVFVPRVVAGAILVKEDAAAALQNLGAAERILPGNAQVSLLRGAALERLGRRQEAADAYREAVRRDPQGEVGAEASKRLQALEAR